MAASAEVFDIAVDITGFDFLYYLCTGVCNACALVDVRLVLGLRLGRVLLENK